MNLVMSISVCMLIVSNVLLMSNVTVMVRSGGIFFETCCNCIVDAL